MHIARTMTVQDVQEPYRTAPALYRLVRAPYQSYKDYCQLEHLGQVAPAMWPFLLLVPVVYP